MSEHGFTTSWTLLRKLLKDPSDQAAWVSFDAQYRVPLFRFCRRRGLQESDAEDVVQEVLLAIKRCFEQEKVEKRSDSAFRALLLTITRRAIAKYCEARRRANQASGDSEVLRRLESQEAMDTLAEELDRASQQEFLDAAMKEVEATEKAKAIAAFKLRKLEKRTAKDIGELLGMSPGAVHTAACRIWIKVQEAARRLAKEAREKDDELSSG